MSRLSLLLWNKRRKAVLNRLEWLASAKSFPQKLTIALQPHIKRTQKEPRLIFSTACVVQGCAKLGRSVISSWQKPSMIYEQLLILSRWRIAGSVFIAKKRPSWFGLVVEQCTWMPLALTKWPSIQFDWKILISLCFVKIVIAFTNWLCGADLILLPSPAVRSPSQRQEFRWHEDLDTYLRQTSLP